MPLLSIARFFTTLLSLAILGAAGYLLWSWFQGETITDPYGAPLTVREDWRLWTGLALLAWSFLGRLVVLPLLARPDERPLKPAPRDGGATVGASGASVYVETHGPENAPTIVFTHGWGLDSTVWSYAKEDLGDRFRLVLWDLPGLGRSRPPADGDISLEDMAAELGAVLSARARQPFVLVGHSIGGMVIQTLARDRPRRLDRLAGIVLLNTTHTNPLKTMILSGPAQALQKPVLEPAMRLAVRLQPLVWLFNWQSYLSGSAHLAQRLGFGKYVTRSQLEHTTRLIVSNAPGVQARGNLAMFAWDATDALKGMPAPVLVIGGDKDIVTKPDAGRRIAESATRGRLEIIADVNHLGFLEQADRYNRLIGDFALAVLPGAHADRPAPSPRTWAGDERVDDEKPQRPGWGEPRPTRH